MYEKFSSCDKVALHSNDDTNFNGYPIWNSEDYHAVVCIYEIKDGVEHYYGTHKEEPHHEIMDVPHYPEE
jgi:hypothetical protein